MVKKQKRFARHVIASIMLVTGMAQVHAEVDSVVRAARTLLDQGQAKQAFDLLEPLETPRAGDPDFDTVLGIAALETTQYTRAIFALERVLAVQPENSRARAELGRALFAVGDTQASRRVLLETKRDNIPVEAAATIDQFLQAIDKAEAASRSSVKAYVEAVGGYDSNINSGPTTSNIAVPALGGLIFALNGAALPTKDNFASIGGGVSGRLVLDPRWSLIAGVSGNLRGNQQNSVLNSQQLDGNAGATYRYDKHEFSGVVAFGSYDIARARARDQAGVVGEWTYRIDGFRQLNTYIQYGTLKYPGQNVRDVTRTVVGTSYAHDFRNSYLAFGGIYTGTEKPLNSLFPYLGHTLYGVRLGGQKEFRPDLSAFTSIAYENRRFGGADPLFLLTRNDDQLNFALGLSWIPGKFWRVTPQLTLTKVKSNVAIADYNRATLSVSLRRDF